MRDGMFTLRQPLAFAERVDCFGVEVMAASGAPPTVESGSLGLVLERARESIVAGEFTVR